MFLKNGVVTSASGFTININGLGAKPSYNNMTTGNSITPTAPTRDTTIFNINYTMLFVYNSTLVDGGAWVCYRGYDANTNTIGYQLRTNSYVLNASDGFRYYVLLFTSADGTKWVPANSNKSNSATTAKTVNQTPINPFGEIVYCGNSTNYSAGGAVTATAIWQQYTVTLGYSFNKTGAALTLTTKKPVYVKCAPQANGSAIIDSTTPYVQDLPTTEDGKIYILLGMAYSATAIELLMVHPVYYYKGGTIRLWTNAAETDISGKANIADLANVAFSGSYNDLSNTPSVGDTNVIEAVKVNGTALTPDANKAVDITVPEPLIIDFDKENPTVQIDTCVNISAALASGREVFMRDDDNYIYSLSYAQSDDYEYFYSFSCNRIPDESTTYSVNVYNGNILYNDDEIEVLSYEVAEGWHSHGDINSDGTLLGNAISIANNDKFVIADASNSNKIAKTSISFDGSTTTKALTPKGTWETFLQSETSLSKGTTIGNGNAVTDISVNGHQITLTKGSTFLTSETDPTVPAWAKTDSKPSYSISEISGAYPAFYSS